MMVWSWYDKSEKAYETMMTIWVQKDEASVIIVALIIENEN